MKKHFSILLFLFVVFSLLFVLCDESERDLEPTICKITVKSEGCGTVSITNYIGTSVNVLIGNNIEVVATPADGSAFIGWYISGTDAPVSTEARFVFTVSENTTLTAKFSKRPLPVGKAGEAIDLGLSVKWASFNVGASKPEEYGGYYAWGETKEQSYYDWSTYKWCNGSSINMTKYCTTSSYGAVDNKTVLDPADDVAHVKWGGTWRMPTLEEQEELLNNCTWQWTTRNGVNGYKVTGPNGNSIFLPATGCRFGTGVYGRGSYGFYFSGSLNSNNSSNAYYLYFDSGYQDLHSSYRFNGRSVRPVSN